MTDRKDYTGGKLAEAHAKALELHGRQGEVLKLSGADYTSGTNVHHLLGHPPGYVAPEANASQPKPPGKSA